MLLRPRPCASWASSLSNRRTGFLGRHISEKRGLLARFTASKSKSDEFDALNRNEETTAQVLPRKIREIFDLTVLFYEALLLNPSAGFLWSTRIMRNFFLAGLALKDSNHISAIHDAYASTLGRRELRIYMWIVNSIQKHYRQYQLKADAASTLPSLQSEDRLAFPTLHEASAAVQPVWARGKSQKI